MGKFSLNENHQDTICLVQQGSKSVELLQILKK